METLFPEHPGAHIRRRQQRQVSFHKYPWFKLINIWRLLVSLPHWGIIILFSTESYCSNPETFSPKSTVVYMYIFPPTWSDFWHEKACFSTLVVNVDTFLTKFYLFFCKNHFYPNSSKKTQTTGGRFLKKIYPRLRVYDWTTT